jgi:hypothetical protein
VIGLFEVSMTSIDWWSILACGSTCIEEDLFNQIGIVEN